MEMMDQHKQDTFDEIDDVFGQMIRKAQDRRDKLKEEYEKIEDCERNGIMMKFRKTEHDLLSMDVFNNNFLNFYNAFGNFKK